MTWSTSSLPKFKTVVVQSSLVSTVKAASPSTLVLNYKEAMGLADDCGTLVDICRTGITYQQAAAHDSAYPSDRWILRDSAGRPIPNRSYAHIYMANVGSASYQRQWATNVIGGDKRLGYHGTTLDNVSANISWWAPDGVYPTLYTSDSAWEPAMKSFISYIGPQLKAQGLYVRASAGKRGPNDGSATKAWWTALAPYVSGLLVEYFEQAGDQVLFYNDTNNWHGYWESWLGLVDVAQNAGVDFYGGMKGNATDTNKMIYGKASFLLKWNGKGGGFFWQMNTAYSDPWNAAWTKYIGTPKAARSQVGVGWRRDYTGGTVLVNPHPTSAQTFNLGASYLTPSGTSVSSVTLQPVTAMILTGTSTTTTTPSLYSLVPKHSGKCLDVSASSLLDGANVQQWTCRGTSNQTWKFVSTGDGYYQVVPIHSGKCLTVNGALLTDGANAMQLTCVPSAYNQRWKLVSMGDGYYQFIAKHSNKCLTVNGALLTDGANVMQLTCVAGAYNQRWKLVLR